MVVLQKNARQKSDDTVRQHPYVESLLEFLLFTIRILVALSIFTYFCINLLLVLYLRGIQLVGNHDNYLFFPGFQSLSFYFFIFYLHVLMSL